MKESRKRMSNSETSGRLSIKVGEAQVAAPSGAAKSGVQTREGFSPLDVFHISVARAENLLRIHKAAHGKRSKPEKYLADAHRAAIVLAVSALDAFVRTFIIHRIRLLVARPAAMPDSLAAKVKTFLKEDGLLEAARKSDLLERVEKAFQADFEKRSFQGSRAIAECIEMVGFPNIFHTIAVKLDINEELLVQNLDNATQRRHIIAHKGDHNLAENPPSENPIIKSDVEECIKLMKSIAEQINALGVA